MERRGEGIAPWFFYGRINVVMLESEEATGFGGKEERGVEADGRSREERQGEGKGVEWGTYRFKFTSLQETSSSPIPLTSFGQPGVQCTL